MFSITFSFFFSQVAAGLAALLLPRLGTFLIRRDLDEMARGPCLTTAAALLAAATTTVRVSPDGRSWLRHLAHFISHTDDEPDLDIGLDRDLASMQVDQDRGHGNHHHSTTDDITRGVPVCCPWERTATLRDAALDALEILGHRRLAARWVLRTTYEHEHEHEHRHTDLDPTETSVVGMMARWAFPKAVVVGPLARTRLVARHALASLFGADLPDLKYPDDQNTDMKRMDTDRTQVDDEDEDLMTVNVRAVVRAAAGSETLTQSLLQTLKEPFEAERVGVYRFLLGLTRTTAGAKFVMGGGGGGEGVDRGGGGGGTALLSRLCDYRSEVGEMGVWRHAVICRLRARTVDDGADGAVEAVRAAFQGGALGLGVGSVGKGAAIPIYATLTQ